MKLLKALFTAWTTFWDMVGLILMSMFAFAIAFGFVTVGCSQSLWTNKMACTITMVFNSFK